MTSALGPRRIPLLCAMLASLFLAGCFDIEQRVTLKGSGAGAFEVMLRIDPALKGSLETETILGEQAAPIEVKREVKDGQYVQEERVTFNSLPELRVPNGTLAVVNNGATLFGVGPKKLTLTRTIENAGADVSAAAAMGTVFGSRTFTMKVTLPGWVDKAHPLIVGGEAIAPKVSGSTVTWQIPMARALSSPRLDYRVDFFAYMDIDGNVTAGAAQDRLQTLAPPGVYDR